MKKIRFVNLIRTCKEVQGKAYTAIVIATIVAAIPALALAIWAEMFVIAAIFSVAMVAFIIGLAIHFGVENIPDPDEDLD